MSSLYLDTSASVKLIKAEVESEALSSFIGDSELVTSSVGRVELLRVARRISVASVSKAIVLLEAIALAELTENIVELAWMLEPPILRSLDAIHLATALSIRGEVEAFVTYDKLLCDAALAAGLLVASPV